MRLLFETFWNVPRLGSCTCSPVATCFSPQSREKHLRSGQTWLPGVSPVSRHQIIQRAAAGDKFGEMKRVSQMSHCWVMLITPKQGKRRERERETKKNRSVVQMCWGSISPRNAVGTERNNSSSHGTLMEGRRGCLVLSLSSAHLKVLSK